MKRMNVSIEIDKEWFEKNKQKFIDCYDNEEYTDSKEKGSTYRIELDIENNEFLINNDDEITISGGDNKNNLYFWYKEKPGIDELLNLAQVISKYYNKAKAVIESLK